MPLTIFDFADIIDKNIEITRFPNQNNRWIAKFDRGEIKEDCTLAGVYGTGANPVDAINDYIENIKGKKIVFNAMSEKNREEHMIPKNIAKEEHD